MYLTQSVFNSYCTVSLLYGRSSLRLTRAESIGHTHSKVTVENRLIEIYKIWNLVGLQSLYAYSSQSKYVKESRELKIVQAREHLFRE